METSNDQLRIARHLLLSSPPGQFDHILKDLQDLIPTVLTERRAEELQKEYNARSGREALQQPDSSAVGNVGLEEGIQNYVNQYYTSKGVKANFQISQADSEREFSILLYAERICFQQFHTGSWTARYSIQFLDGDTVEISGKMSLHAHTFERGNIQLKSMVDLPSVQTSQKGIFSQIQKWDEDTVMSLHSVYDEMSGDILKKFRRIMPVTRRRFDWNVQGHRGLRELGMEVQSRE